jgi:predicted MFS family arabinose efflux permease
MVQDEILPFPKPPVRIGYRSGLVFSTGALAYNVSGLFLNIAANLVPTEFGFLLSEHFLLTEAEASSASLAIPIGELVGVLCTALLVLPSDSYRSIHLADTGALVMAVPFAVWGDSSLEAALSLLFFMFVCTEYTTVMRFARAFQFANKGDEVAMLGVNVQFQFVGRAIGASIAGVLYKNAGHGLLNVVTVVCFGMAAGLMVVAVRQQKSYEFV